MVAHIRVNKARARHLYNQGVTISLLPCKVSYTPAVLNPNSWVNPIKISRETSTQTQNHFDRTVNEFEYYNCCAELGYYAHYYVNKEEYDKVLEETQKWLI